MCVCVCVCCVCIPIFFNYYPAFFQFVFRFFQLLFRLFRRKARRRCHRPCGHTRTHLRSPTRVFCKKLKARRRCHRPCGHTRMPWSLRAHPHAACGLNPQKKILRLRPAPCGIKPQSPAAQARTLTRMNAAGILKIIKFITNQQQISHAASQF